MAFKLADLYVQIGANAQGMESTLGAVRSQLLGLADAAPRIGVSIAERLTGPLLGLASAGKLVGIAIGTAVGGAAVYGLTKAAGVAADLQETVQKVEQTFGTMSKSVIDEANRMAIAFGVPEQEFLDSAAVFGLITEGAGVASSEAAKLSVELTKLGLDAASFFDKPFDVALEKIRSGLVGEAEPLREFGVQLTENAVKAKAFAMGMGGVGRELTSQEKTLARVALIKQLLAKVDGDLERTSGGYKNQLRQLSGHLKNIATDIGTLVLPVFEKILQATNFVVGHVAWMVKSVVGYIQGMFESLAGFLGITDTDSRERLKAIDKRNEELRQTILAEQGLADKKGGKSGKENHGHIYDLESFAKSLQVAGLGGDPNARKQLEVANKQLQKLDVIAQAVKKRPIQAEADDPLAP